MLMIMMSGKNLYKQISTNDHLCATAISVSFFDLTDSPYSESCLNLSIMATAATATKVRPQLPN